MGVVVVIVLMFFGLMAGLGAFAYFTYQKKLRRAKAIERGLKMVPILIHLPPPSSDTQGGSRDIREVMREKTAQAEVLYNLLAGTATEGFKSNFYGQRHIALELIVTDGLVHFFAAVPVALVSVVKKAVLTAYPGAQLEEAEDHNIFNQEGRLAATLGGEMVLRAESAYPIATYEQLERDPMEALLTTVSALDKKDGVAIQIMIRPANPKWVTKSHMLAESLRKGKNSDMKFTAMDLAKAVVKAPEERRAEEKARNGGAPDVSQLQLSQVERIEEKTKHPGFEVLVRVIVSTQSVVRSQQLLRDISTTFALYEAPGLNGFKFLPALDVQGLVTAFIFRFFPPELGSNVLSSAELATLFHLPDSQFTPSASVTRQQTKQVDGPVSLPATGLMFGYNEFRGAKKEIRLSPEDRRRHTYILGQTGTGKSTMLENLAVQDMVAGNGFAFIDPHGDSAEKLLALVPKERAEDIVYFNPADTQYPLGLNLFEFSDPAQKDFLVQETINMLYKLYDPGHTGIIGPRYEHWYRNAALTLMADPNGATFIEIPKVFTDTDYLKAKFKYLKDPTVIEFWTKEMAQTSDYHKSEMLGWFVSKFGAFQNNEMMRNIIGQTKSSFNIRDIMDNKKILIVNLSKGRIGELNSQLLGMIFVIKFQAAAMSRADMPEAERKDFALYVDEFQNFSTDSFASILSEARKYRLNLIVANQFIGQLSNEIRDAVFGNIGTIVAHRMGPEDAEFMVKQFAPVFDASDLVNIPNYHAAMRLMIGGLPSQPFSIADSAPLGVPNAELGLAIKQLSAAKYGHDKAVVEADLFDRMTTKGPKPIKPAEASKVAAAGDGVVPAAGVPSDPGVGAGGVPAPPVMPASVSGGANAGVSPQPTVSTVPSMIPSSAPITAAPPMAAANMPMATSAAPAAPAGTSADANIGPAASAPMQPGASAVGVAFAGTPAGLATAPPPIGAPPINIDGPSGAGVVTPSAAPVSAPSPLAGIGMTPPPIGAPPMDIPPIGAAPQNPISQASLPGAAAAAFQAATSSAAKADMPGPSPAAAIVSPPPIGAPPVDLPGPIPASVQAVSNAPARKTADASGTLSLQDITGGQVPRETEHEPSPLDDVPLLASPVAEPAPAPFVGTGRPLDSDPYANIDILGEAAQGGQTAAEPVVAAGQVGDGQPLADDPYAQIDILSEASTAVAPVNPAPVRPVSGPASPRQITSPRLAPIQPYVVEQPVANNEPRFVSSPSATIPVPAQANPVPVDPPRQTEPLPESRTVEEPMAEPEPRSWQDLRAPVAPGVAVQSEAPILRTEPSVPVATEGATVVPVTDEIAAKPTPEVPVVQEVSEPVPVEPSTQSFVHFVDPAAESVLSRPDVPASTAAGTGNDDFKLSFAGLPDGVAMVPQPSSTVAPAQSAGSAVNSPVTAVQAVPKAVTPTPASAPLPLAAQALNQDASPAPTTGQSSPTPVAAATLPPAAVPAIEPVGMAPKDTASVAPVPTVTPQATNALDTLVSVDQSLPTPQSEAVKQGAAISSPLPSEAPVNEVQSSSTQLAAEPQKEIVPEPKAPVTDQSVDAQIKAAEHEIDSLVSTALIRPDDTAGHRRLPADVARTSSDPDSSLDIEMNNSAGAADDPVQLAGPPQPAVRPPAHHGLKVIQPLEPIVPAREKFAREIAEMNAQAAGLAVPAVSPHDAAKQSAPVAAITPPAPAPQPAASPAPAQPVAAPELEAIPEATILTKPQPSEAAPAAPQTPSPTPPTQKLQPASILTHAMADVAAHLVGPAGKPVAQPAQTHAPQAYKAPSEERPSNGEGQELADDQKKPAEVQKKLAQVPAAQAPSRPPRQRRRHGSTTQRSEKPAEIIASKEEEEHNRPSAASAAAAPLTGKLILPTGQKPAVESDEPKPAQPKKLAPGEVYVDASGNVRIGE